MELPFTTCCPVLPSTGRLMSGLNAADWQRPHLQFRSARFNQLKTCSTTQAPGSTAIPCANTQIINRFKLPADIGLIGFGHQFVQIIVQVKTC